MIPSARALSTRRALDVRGLDVALAMLVGVIAVGLFVHASTGAFVFMASLLTLASVFWMWVLRRLLR
jgi:hypothetical protein